MRKSFTTVVTNRNVFGLNQDRAVSLRDGACAHATQHLAARHASKCARSYRRAFKRRGSDCVVVTGAVSMAWAMRPAITGPQWQPVRLTSPALATA